MRRRETYRIYADHGCTKWLRTELAVSHQDAFLAWWYDAAEGLGSAYVKRASDYEVRQFVGELVITEIPKCE